MSNRCAIVTLNVGRRFSGNFKQYFMPGWQEYCRNHKLDLVHLETLLDQSPRALARSPAWQKLIIHTAKEVRGYDRLAWVDADVVIRPDAPNIFEVVESGRIGAVDDFATPTRDDHDLVMEELYRGWDRDGIRYARNRTPAEYYANYGIRCDLNSVVQTGVMVYEPEVHGSIFQRVYQNYEEAAECSLNHEMRPLSYELLSAGLVQWINPKFNMQWSYYRGLHYSFLDAPERFRLIRWLNISAYGAVLASCAQNAYSRNYFLHFAGGSKDYHHITPFKS